jgi:hypothetical protein
MARQVYRGMLSPETFDLPYLDGLAARYADGLEMRGAELNDLTALVLCSATAWPAAV